MRYLPMNDAVFSELNVPPQDDSNYVFANPKTGKPYIDVKKGFKGACRRAGIEGLRFHDLRHTFATRLVEKGIHIKTIRNLLGHHSITVTERYAHSTDEVMRKAVESLDEEAQTGDNLVTMEIKSELIN